MVNKFPFYYELRFRLLGFDKDNNVDVQSYTKKFDSNLALENRLQVFQEFDDILSDIKQNGKLKKNKLGNYYIEQPSFITKSVNENKVDFENFYQFREEISIFLIIEDVEIAKNILNAFEYEDMVESEFEIHKITSYDYDQQNIVDNLEKEYTLYSHYDIDTKDWVNIVYLYGVDYAESGEDKESGAKRTILKTPHIWTNIVTYNEQMSNQEEESSTTEQGLDIKSIIERGESNQVEFKSSLLYNFKTNAGGISIKYIIAKAICGFLNSNGGAIFIGVKDDGTIQGIEYDYSLFEDNEKDKILLEVDSLLAHFFGLSIKPLINVFIFPIEGKDILILSVTKSPKPSFLKNKKENIIEKEFYVRLEASTRQISDTEEIIEYIFNKE